MRGVLVLDTDEGDIVDQGEQQVSCHHSYQNTKEQVESELWESDASGFDEGVGYDDDIRRVPNSCSCPTNIRKHHFSYQHGKRVKVQHLTEAVCVRV